MTAMSFQIYVWFEFIVLYDLWMAFNLKKYQICIVMKKQDMISFAAIL